MNHVMAAQTDYTDDMPEVAMHVCAVTKGETAAIVHVQLALCTAAAVERYHLRPSTQHSACRSANQPCTF